jgi:hypothetical protein
MSNVSVGIGGNVLKLGSKRINEDTLLIVTYKISGKGSLPGVLQEPLGW